MRGVDARGGVRREGEKVRHLLETALLRTPQSRVLFLPGAKSWQKKKKKKKDLGMLARRPWSKVLAEELGAGRERGSPGRAGPKLGLGGGCRGWTPVTRAGWGAGGPLAARSCTPGSPPAPGEVPASKLETSPLGAASRPPSRAPFRPHRFPPALL